VGEIGFPRREFLFELKWWEVLSILRGYNNRNREMWSATRWQTFHLMCVSMADLKKAGIYKPTDLIKFPWEKDIEKSAGDMLTKEDIKEMQRMMAEENARLAKIQGR
jgi:hypothetical protein